MCAAPIRVTNRKLYVLIEKDLDKNTTFIRDVIFDRKEALALAKEGRVVLEYGYINQLHKETK